MLSDKQAGWSTSGRHETAAVFITVHFHSHSYIFASWCSGPVLSFLPLSSQPSLAALPVPQCSLLSLPPSNILLTHNCGTLSPVLPINPHHRHLGPLSRLSLSLPLFLLLSLSLSPPVSLSTLHSKLSKSEPFQQRVPEHFSQATRPDAEHAFYCTDRLVVNHSLPPSTHRWLENVRQRSSQSKGHTRYQDKQQSNPHTCRVYNLYVQTRLTFTLTATGQTSQNKAVACFSWVWPACNVRPALPCLSQVWPVSKDSADAGFESENN